MSRSPNILVLDDDASVVSWLVDSLQEEGFSVTGETSAHRALDALTHREFDVVVSDVEMPELRGVDLMNSLRKVRPAQQVILITAFGSIDLAVEAVKAGAADFIAKPFRIEALTLSLRRTLRERHMEREITRLREAYIPSEPTPIVAQSDTMKRLLELTRKAAKSDLPILFTGESGVGKGAFARYAHGVSERRSRPFVSINCATLPSSLAESELFGVRKGAFTDAKQDRRGVFEQAHQGTLFLDEVGELPLELQPKLLQALESKRVRPLGASSESSVDVRIFAATNRALEEALRDRTFRADLYHRLNVVRVELPPLRDRPEDISPIVDQVLTRLSTHSPRGVLTLTTDARSWLVEQPWPGNTRELINAVERAVALSDGPLLRRDDFVPFESKPSTPPELLDVAVHHKWTLAELERRYISKVLDQTGGHKGNAAKILGLDRRTLYRKVAELQSRATADEEKDS